MYLGIHEACLTYGEGGGIAHRNTRLIQADIVYRLSRFGTKKHPLIGQIRADTSDTCDRIFQNGGKRVEREL